MKNKWFSDDRETRIIIIIIILRNDKKIIYKYMYIINTYTITRIHLFYSIFTSRRGYTHIKKNTHTQSIASRRIIKKIKLYRQRRIDGKQIRSYHPSPSCVEKIK